ncbi:MAG: 16S rRNA (guanine(527)-N(7))-methyltransferase RsmG [Oscillospiraceae bacterium]|nr:16S rRNA (guanine(527)-N(7))-methyltransferase RsmG [Oscillospiraceae bacterium]
MEQMIREGLLEMGLSLEAAPALAEYGRLLLEKNQVMNLTALREPEQVARLHFLDSAGLFGAADLAGKKVIDIGSGGGFPGLPLRLIEPSIQLTLLDALGKRVTWLSEVTQALGTADVTCIHARAEEQALLPDYREQFDIATSRAVADLRVLAELCLPYVKPGGAFLAMKSVDSEEELSAALRGIQLLGGDMGAAHDYRIPGTDVIHRILVIKKAGPTPKGYPRRWAKIQKAPL